MTEEIYDIERKEIETAEDYQRQSEINDMRQHTNKIIQGIKSLNSHDANRAIWELFQNAVDLSRDCHIEVGINEDSLRLCHNGIPFTPMTMDCLFKQVGSKTLEEKKEAYTEEDPVGQYGTGFMTSHVFGSELIINGAIVKGKGYIPLNNFVSLEHLHYVIEEIGTASQLLMIKNSAFYKRFLIAYLIEIKSFQFQRSKTN